MEAVDKSRLEEVPHDAGTASDTGILSARSGHRLTEWYGPAGLSIETHEADMRKGGAWRFDMVGVFEGKEQRFENLMRFVEIVPNERIVMDYGTPDPADPDRFRMTVTFDEQADGKTVLTMRQLHPSRERRQAVIGFGAVEYGLQTLDGLAAWLAG